MKRVISMIPALSLLALSSPAHAVYLPGYDRPVQSAEVKITQASGDFRGAEKAAVTETRRDGAKDVVTYILTVGGEESLRFVRIDTKDAGCGSVAHTAIDVESLLDNERGGYVLTIVDHSTRICEDYRPGLWDVSVRKVGPELMHEEVTTLQGYGTPEPVFSIL